MYQHHNWQGALLDYPVSKVVCVGSNYAKHIQEMGSAVPEEPVLFIKPETALCDIRQPLVLPQGLGSVHHEVELAVLIGATLRQATEEHVEKAIAGYGVALDLTLRDVQGDNLSFKRQGMTRRSMPCLFHANLFALDVARCPSSTCGVALAGT